MTLISRDQMPPRTRVAIIAIEGSDRWEFDFAESFDEAYAKLCKWNDRAAREWPGLRFTLQAQPSVGHCECGAPLPAGHAQCPMCAARAGLEEP